jgi:hypothetical protein
MRFTYEYLVFQPRIKHVHQIASCCRVVEYASSAVSHDAGAHMVYRQTTGEKSHRILFYILWYIIFIIKDAPVVACVDLFWSYVV